MPFRIDLDSSVPVSGSGTSWRGRPIANAASSPRVSYLSCCCLSLWAFLRSLSANPRSESWHDVVVCGDLGEVPANRSSPFAAGDTGMLGVSCVHCLGCLLLDGVTLAEPVPFGYAVHWVKGS